MNTDASKQIADVRQLGRATANELQVLLQRRPLRVWLDVGCCYGLILAAFTLLALSASIWSAVLAFVLIGNRQYAMSILAHDGKHGNLFADRRWNDRFTILALCIPIGVDFHGEWANHRAHHSQLGSESDPDRHLYVMANKATRGRFLLFLSAAATFVDSFTKATRSGTRSGEPRPFLLAFLSVRGPTLAAQVLIFAAITAFFPWWYYPLFWIAPIYFLMFVPHKLRMFCEHGQAALPDEAADDRRLITYLPGFLERALLSPMNNNFHAEHHLWPSAPYYNLPRLHRLVGSQPQIEWRRSYVGFLWRCYRRLPLQPAAAPAA